jgi:hypothetical protein
MATHYYHDKRVFCRNFDKLGMGLITALGTMVFIPLDVNRFDFQRINNKIKDG